MLKLLDTKGREIKPGHTVRTRQPAGGVLPPAEPQTGIVEEGTDPFGRETLLIRWHDERLGFDLRIDISAQINLIIK